MITSFARLLFATLQERNFNEKKEEMKIKLFDIDDQVCFQCCWSTSLNDSLMIYPMPAIIVYGHRVCFYSIIKV